MIKKLKELESVSRKLELLPENWEMLNKEAYKYASLFLNELENKPAYVSEDLSKQLLDLPISEQPGNFRECLATLQKSVDYSGINPASGGHLGYIPGGGIPVSAIGDYLAAITNRYAGIFYASPGAVRMENLLLEWLATIIGYSSCCGGNLTSGGSVANLIAVVTARKIHELKARDFHKVVVYSTIYAHHSVRKAVCIAGMEESIFRMIDTDENYRMKPEILEKTILEDRKNGLIPWLVVSSVGNTDTGMLDPIGSISEICQKHKLWHHADAAYGGFFVLVQDQISFLGDLKTADSVILDPHKGLFLPYGSGAVLVKNKEHIVRAHTYEANYMQDTTHIEEISPAHVSPEMSRHFRGLRMWLPLQLMGVQVFRSALQEKLLLARYFYDKIQSIKNMEVGPYPDLSVVIFRYIPSQGNADDCNKKLLDFIHKDGRVFISSTRIQNRFVLRLAVLSFRTHLQHIDLLLEIIEDGITYITK